MGARTPRALPKATNTPMEAHSRQARPRAMLLNTYFFVTYPESLTLDVKTDPTSGSTDHARSHRDTLTDCLRRTHRRRLPAHIGVRIDNSSRRLDGNSPARCARAWSNAALSLRPDAPPTQPSRRAEPVLLDESAPARDLAPFGRSHAVPISDHRELVANCL